MTANAPTPPPSSPSARFEGLVALITGVSDQGIGGAVAERLGAEGAQLLLTGLRPARRLAKRLQRADRRFAWIACDVTRRQEIEAAIEECQRAYGRLDVVINNAGIETAQPLQNMAVDEWQRLLEVNLQGAIAMAQASLRQLSQPGGVIVNISSALSLGGCANFSIYSAAKAGLNGFTQSLAWELAPQGIRVVGVAPGLVSTPMLQKHSGRFDQRSWDQIQISHPLGIGLPHDVAAAVAFLASREARWITGVTLPLGWTYGYPLPISMQEGPISIQEGE